SSAAPAGPGPARCAPPPAGTGAAGGAPPPSRADTADRSGQQRRCLRPECTVRIAPAIPLPDVAIAHHAGAVLYAAQRPAPAGCRRSPGPLDAVPAGDRRPALWDSARLAGGEHRLALPG